MHEDHRRGPDLARSRATRRLRNLTIGTALLGIGATGGLGWLAAITNDGSGGAATTAAVTVSSVTGTTGAAGTATATSAAATSSPTATFSPTATPVVTAVGGPGAATTGGS